ncbi:MAG: M20/M25/M40 family metallo-hydrolase [Chloroflexi bacterium]|nr:M20/M25/M40 family metallo-hydrolase [Chloroflexota bacterium]
MKTSPSSQKQRDYIGKAIGLVERDQLTKLAMDMVNIPSRTGEEEDLARFMVDYMAGLGLEAYYQAIEERRGNAIGRLRGSGEGPDLMFNGHLDTTWVGVEQEDYPSTGLRPQPEALKPIARLEGDWISGLGIWNMKGADACTVIAADAVKRAGVPLKGDVILTLVAGEIEKAQVEAAMKDYTGRHFRGSGVGTEFALRHGVTADFGINVEPDEPVSSATAGFCWFKVRTKGRTGYGPRRSTAKNAILDMYKVIEEIEAWAKEYSRQTTEEMQSPQASIGAIEAGWPYKPSAIPGVCQIYVDVRILPEVAPNSIRREFGEVLGRARAKHPDLDVDFDMYFSRPGTRTDPQNWIVRSCMGGYEWVTGRRQAHANGTSGSRDDSFMRLFGIPTASMGPTRGRPEQGGLPFWAGEAMNINTLLDAVKIYIYAIVDTCTRTREEVGLAGR